MMKNPDMMKNMQGMMGGMGGGAGGGDPNAMAELMKNPSIGKLIDNAPMLDSMVGMLTNPAMGGQIDQMAAQAGVSGKTLTRGLGCLVKFVYVLKFMRKPVIFYSLCVMMLSFVLKWTGFTKGHLHNYLF